MSIDLLLLFIALLVTAAVGAVAARGKKTGIGYALSNLLIAALLAGRIVFIALRFETYLASPWSVFDIRDGGFNPWAALGAALLVALWQGWRHAALRQPLALALASGALVWGGISSAILLMGNASLPKSPLTTLAGAPADLAQIAAGKPLVINLWATWCPPCRRELPALAAAQKQETWVQFVFADQGEDAITVQRYLDAAGLKLDNVLLDRGARIAPEVGAGGLPTTLFYDAKGRLVDTHVGQLTSVTLARKLSRLRANNPG